MRWTKTIAVGLVSLLILAAVAAAQNAPKSPAEPKPPIPLKVDVVISEYAGAKRVASLPYTLALHTNGTRRSDSRLRMGLTVPVERAAKPANGGPATNVIQYENAGTSIDCGVDGLGGGVFEVNTRIQWTSLYSSASASSGERLSPEIPTGSLYPIFRRFDTSLNLVMHDGQTIQSTMGTDPVSGHVIKVDVTLHVVKGQ